MAAFRVYGECSACGFHTSRPEGSIWPDCPECGNPSALEHAMIIASPEGGFMRVGTGFGPHVAALRYGVRLGYRGNRLMQETEAIHGDQ